MESQNRTVEHYRDHELVLEVSRGASGWEYSVRIVAHKGDYDNVAREERSTQPLATEIEALHAGRSRGHALIDELVDG